MRGSSLRLRYPDDLGQVSSSMSLLLVKIIPQLTFVVSGTHMLKRGYSWYARYLGGLGWKYGGIYIFLFSVKSIFIILLLISDLAV